MKKIKIFTVCVLLFICPCLSAHAQAADTVASLPRLVVTDYTVEGGKLAAGSTGIISVTLTNTSKTADINNLKAVFSDPGGDILPKKTNSVYIEALARGRSYTWSIPVTVGEAALGGARAVSISSEYETADAQALSATDDITVEIEPKQSAEPKTDSSQPRLMVTGYTVKGGSIAPAANAVLSVKIKNMSSTKAVSNIKLAFTDGSSDIRPDGMGTAFVERIGAGKTYEWTFNVRATHTASTGEHAVSVAMEYEDGEQAYSASDILRLTVRQSVKLDFDGAQLPARVVQGETPTVTINLMNMGKSRLSNCLISFDIASLESGGSVLVGSLEPGESRAGTANLRVDKDALGEVSGTITIAYEDDFGKAYKKEVPVSTVVEKKVEQASAAPKQEEKGNGLWWLFIIIGALAGAGAGGGIAAAVYSGRQRSEDEKRL